MKKTYILSFCILLGALSMKAGEPWKTTLWEPTEKINLRIDLYEESIEVPTMEMFGPMNGYMSGNIYGVWTVTSHKVLSERKAELHLSNDLGSETQEALLEMTSDSTYTLSLKGYTAVKRAVGRKLVKIPTTLNFKVKSPTDK